MVYVKQGSKRVNTRVFRAKTKKIDKYSRRRIDQREATATLLSFLEFTVKSLQKSTTVPDLRGFFYYK